MSDLWDRAISPLKYDLVEAFHDQERGAMSFNDYIDRLLKLLRPAPPQTIDRDALVQVFQDYEAEIWSVAQRDFGTMPDQSAFADQILALLRPVDGVTLTREEAAFVLKSTRLAITEVGPRTDLVALAERLEAAS